MLSITSIVRLCILTFIFIAAWQIVQPFVGAALLAAVLVISTWPLNILLGSRLKNRVLRSTVLILFWLIVLAGPLTWLGYVIADNGNMWLAAGKNYVQAHSLTAELPEWIRKLPWVGSPAQDYWYKLTQNKEEYTRLFKLAIAPITDVGFQGVQKVGGAALQLLGVLAIAWFMYFEGTRLAKWAQRISHRIDNELGEMLLQRAVLTVKAVMLGLVGSAIGQSVAMAFGLWMAGVPQLGLLGAATFFLSLVPGGPVLIWGGAAAWLYQQESFGWMTFLILWGVIVVSSVDNIIKPILISKGSDQSLLLMTLGVFGGALAFGFVGLFLGPVILGVVATLLDVWLEQEEGPNKIILPGARRDTISQTQEKT